MWKKVQHELNSTLICTELIGCFNRKVRGQGVSELGTQKNEGN